MSEFGGLWKQQNNPACTESLGVFITLKLDTILKKKFVSTKSRHPVRRFLTSAATKHFLSIRNGFDHGESFESIVEIGLFEVFNRFIFV